MLEDHIKFVIAAFPQVNPNRDVFRNQDGTEAVICINGAGWVDLGDDGEPAAAADYFISVDAEGDTRSASAIWETGFDA